MARPKASAPALRYHLSGQSVVTIDGRDYYLGKHGSPESLARYAVLIRIYQEGGLSLPKAFEVRSLDAYVQPLLDATKAMPGHQEDEPLRVEHLVAAFRAFIAKRYANSAQELHRYGMICDDLQKYAGSMLVDKFGPKLLQEFRQRWIDAGKARVYCNRLTNYTIRAFRWGVSQELVDESTPRRLRTVEPLRCGQTEAHETEPVKPVAIEWVRATAKELSPVLRAMLRVQTATGMRPSELCTMRPCDIDRSGEVWLYWPAKHKTSNRGKTRIVPIVGDAREALTDYLNRPADAYLFNPAESVAWYNAQKRAKRKTKVQPSQQNRRKAKPAKTPRERFDSHSYRQSIQRAAKRAGVPHWHPYQLRHLAATTVRDALSLEEVQALLGHSDLRITQRYAKPTHSKAIEAARHAPSLGGDA